EALCCEGNLCNREGPVARHIAADPMSPSGADLSCYACSTANEPGIPPAINCSHPIKQQCGEDPLTTDKQDRCVTITMSSRDGLGNSLYQEMRHCASEQYCSHGFCVHANVSGSLTSCNAKCCYGNMCNNDGMTTASTPTLKSTKQRESDTELVKNYTDLNQNRSCHLCFKDGGHCPCFPRQKRRYGGSENPTWYTREQRPKTLTKDDLFDILFVTSRSTKSLKNSSSPQRGLKWSSKSWTGTRLEAGNELYLVQTNPNSLSFLSEMQTMRLLCSTSVPCSSAQKIRLVPLPPNSTGIPGGSNDP
ncbi:hypothetical protein AC249_AIPGENE28349, partial [Exaiptasia diaphana]